MGANINSKFMSDHSISSSAEADINEWSYTSICLYGMPRDNFIFASVQKILHHFDEYRIT
jgi:hypothetical protein